MARTVSNKVLLSVGTAVALALAFFVSPLASSSPDGLEKIAADKKIDTNVGNHALSGAPLADYSTAGVGDEGLSTGVAGVVGTVLTLGLGWGVFALVKRSTPRRRTDEPAPSAA